MLRTPGYLNTVQQGRLLLAQANRLSAPTRCVVDIGVSDGSTDCLSREFYGQGFWGACYDLREKQLELCKKAMARLKVKIVHAKVTPDNVGALLQEQFPPGPFDLLGLDIDGYELAILHAMLGAGYRPAFVYVEINETVPPPVHFSVEYSEQHAWSGCDNYFGVSLQKLHDDFCSRHGYVVLDLFQNNAVLCLKETAEALGLTPETDMGSLYQAGWAGLVDRLNFKRSNMPYEAMWTMTPAEIVAHLNRMFAAHQGRYTLSATGEGRVYTAKP